MCTPKLDTTLFQNCYREDYANQKSGTDSWRKGLCRGKDPKRLILGGCTVTITVCDNHVAIQPHPLEILSWLQTE